MSASDDTPRSSWITKGIDSATLRALEHELPATELWSLLLHVAERRAAARTPGQLVQQFERDRFVLPAVIDQRTQLELDLALFAAAKAFEAIELAPLAPLGVCAAVAPTSQNRVVASVRGTETVSDPTNVLALESARRLRADPTRIVRLATSHRCTRAQPVPKGSGFAAHFRLFCITNAGHETKDEAFTCDAFAEHIRFHLDAVRALGAIGYSFPPLTVTLLASAQREHLAERIATRLSGVSIKFEPLTQPYYAGLRFMISTASESEAGIPPGIPLIDGGAFDWVATLASNRKLSFVASALGSQLIAHRFRKSTDVPAPAESL